MMLFLWLPKHIFMSSKWDVFCITQDMNLNFLPQQYNIHTHAHTLLSQHLPFRASLYRVVLPFMLNQAFFFCRCLFVFYIRYMNFTNDSPMDSMIYKSKLLAKWILHFKRVAEMFCLGINFISFSLTLRLHLYY